jgi:hypothetical protein
MLFWSHEADEVRLTMQPFWRAFFSVLVVLYVLLSWAAQTSLWVVFSQLAFLALVGFLGRRAQARAEPVWPQLVVLSLYHQVRSLFLRRNASVKTMGRPGGSRESKALPPGNRNLLEADSLRNKAQRPRELP